MWSVWAVLEFTGDIQLVAVRVSQQLGRASKKLKWLDSFIDFRKEELTVLHSSEPVSAHMGVLGTPFFKRNCKTGPVSLIEEQTWVNVVSVSGFLKGFHIEKWENFV